MINCSYCLALGGVGRIYRLKIPITQDNNRPLAWQLMYCKSIRSPQRSLHTAQLSVSGQPHEGLLITYANFHFPLFQLHILCLPRVMCSWQNHYFLDWMQDVISQWTSNSIQAGLFKVNYQERTLLRVFICPIIAPCNRPQFARNANLLKHAPLLHSSLRKDFVWCLPNMSCTKYSGTC